MAIAYGPAHGVVASVVGLVCGIWYWFWGNGVGVLGGIILSGGVCCYAEFSLVTEVLENTSVLAL
jgi:hypothetical protein